MILSIFQNLCILVTAIVFVLYYLHKRGLERFDEVPFRVFMGIAAGIVAMILLKSSVIIDPINHIVIDFRFVPLFLVSIYGGWIPTLIATFIIALYRLVFYQITNVSIWMAIATVLIGISYSIVQRTKQPIFHRFVIAMILHTLIMFIVSFLITTDPSVRVFTLWTHLLIMYCASYLGWRYLEFGIMEIRLHERFRNEASTDFLTNLYNRRKFQDELNLNMQRCLRKNEPMSLMMLDIDKFKDVNDRYGHAKGDEVCATSRKS
jgi:diguanylate cyclase